MKKTFVTMAILICSATAFAQNPSILNPPNSNINASNSHSKRVSVDQDATLTVIKGETHYDLTVDGQKACSIAISAVKYQERNKTLTEGQKRHTCNANYDVLAYSYTHWLSGNTWADFTLVHTGLSEPLAHAEYKISHGSFGFEPHSVHEHN